MGFFGQLVILFAYVYHGVANARNMKRGIDFISKPRIYWPVEESPAMYFGFSANLLPNITTRSWQLNIQLLVKALNLLISHYKCFQGFH